MDGIRKLIDDHIPYRNLEDARLPVHIVTTDIISGDSVVAVGGFGPPMRSSPLPRSPALSAPVRYKDFYSGRRRHLSNTPIRVALRKARGV